MSDETSKAGPVMAGSVDEVQGIFLSDAAMEDAIAKLTLAGFDRAPGGGVLRDAEISACR